MGGPLRRPKTKQAKRYKVPVEHQLRNAIRLRDKLSRVIECLAKEYGEGGGITLPMDVKDYIEKDIPMSMIESELANDPTGEIRFSITCRKELKENVEKSIAHGPRPFYYSEYLND